MAKYAADVPLFVVGTKKDDFLDNYTYKALKKKRGQDPPNTEMAEAEAAEAFAKQQAQIRARLQLDDAHSAIDFMYVSSKGRRKVHLTLPRNANHASDDLQSVKNLLSRTLETIDDENVRLFCVAAQVVDVDQKIDSAVTESIRLGRHAVNTARTPFPLSAAISTPTISRLLCDHILRCFGFPKVTSSRIDDIMRKLVWGNLTQFMVTTTLYFFGVTGVAAGIAVGTFGIGAVFGLVGCLLAAPPTARMIVKCACDLILILERAFSYGGKYVSEKEVEDAAEYYVSPSSDLAGSKLNTRQKRIHSEVDKLIPLISKSMGNNLGTIRVGMRDIIEQHRFGKRVESTTLSSEQEVNLLDFVDDEERALAEADKVWTQSTPSASPMNSPRLSPSVTTRSSYIDSTASPSVTATSLPLTVTSIQTAATRSSTGGSAKSARSGRNKWKLFERKKPAS